MTLNGVMAVYFVISPTSVAFGAYYVKAVKDTLTHYASEM